MPEAEDWEVFECTNEELDFYNWTPYLHYPDSWEPSAPFGFGILALVDGTMASRNSSTKEAEYVSYYTREDYVDSIIDALGRKKIAHVKSRAVRVRYKELSNGMQRVEAIGNDDIIQYGKVEALLSIDGDKFRIDDLRFAPLYRALDMRNSGIRSVSSPDSPLWKTISNLLNQEESKESLLERFLQKIDPDNRLSDDQKERLYRELDLRIGSDAGSVERIVPNSIGYTSRTGFTFGDRFIKVDTTANLIPEYGIYLLDLGSFDRFRAKVGSDDLISCEDIGMSILLMGNLELTEPGISKANCEFGEILSRRFRYAGVNYNLFLMGLFHKEASRYLDNMEPVIYHGAHNLPHWIEGSVPLKSQKGLGLRRFQETQVDERDLASIVGGYIERQHSFATAVIHGDWKPENMVNGHMVDYAMVGRGFEVDELAYYLSDYRFNTSISQFHMAIDTYMQLRSKHDQVFKVRCHQGYQKMMHRLADSALLTQLVLRHSVMNKRDMLDPEKFQQRQYYQHRINQLLREGRFI